MAATYGIVTGPQLYTVIPPKIESMSANTVRFTEDSTFRTIDDLNQSILVLSSQVVDSWERIVLLDYGFTNMDDEFKVVEEFISVQDRLLSRGISHVNLDYITTNSNVYQQIKKGVNGFDGLIYNNAEVLLIHEKVTLGIVLKVMRGEYEGRGLSKPKPKPLSRLETFDKTKKELEEDVRTVSNQILEYEKDIPASQLSKKDYVDLPESEQVQYEHWLKQQEGEGEEDTPSNDPVPDINIYTPPTPQVTEEEESDPVSQIESYGKPTVAQEVYQRQRGSSGIDLDNLPTKDDLPEEPIKTTNLRPSQQYKEDIIRTNQQTQEDYKNRKPQGTIEQLKYLYNQLAQDSNTITDSKLLSDKGSVIAVTGMQHGGVSGVVSQVAEVYAMMGLHVLVLDLDLVERMQTVYFSNYDDKINEGYGLSNALLNVSSGGDIKKASVPVTSRISVCGISRGFAQVDETTSKSVEYSFEDICRDALSDFDLVVIDIPFNQLVHYLHHLNMIDRFLLVLDNKFYEMEHFLEVHLARLVDGNHLIMSDLLKRFSVVLNKVKVNNQDYEGYKIDQEYVKQLLNRVGAPYDTMFVVGELPYHDDWENQFLTNKRFIWDNDTYLGLLKNILRKAV